MSWHTRRLYALEAENLVHLPPLDYQEAYNKLREVWQRHAPARWKDRPPKLEYGEGIPFINDKGLLDACSFSQGRTRIVLCPKHRELASLLHEIAHALQMGHAQHGPKFVALLFKLLVEEEVASLEELALAATRFGLDPRWIKYYDKERNGI